ncbi:EamA family transporter [Piscinibacter sp.]|uniref:EamA family transporter n=1 Tax=Piscinibacter sp. TaxID=1903157 RepID=UPI0039E3A009
MPLSALALVLAAALLHALWNIVAKRAGGDSRFALVVSVQLSLIWAPLGLWAVWGVAPLWGWREWAALAASALVHVLYFTTLLRGYRLADLTVVYPVARGTGPLLSAGGAVLLLGERLTPAGLAGVALVVGGVFLVAGGPGLWARAHDAAQRARVRAGIGYGALTGATIAAYTLIDGYAVTVLAISPILVDWLGNLLRVPMLMTGALRDPRAMREVWRSQWRHALVVAVFGPVAYVLVLYAMRLAPVSHVAPARELSMLFAALLGGQLLGERERGWRLAGAALIAAGVVALTA